MVQQLPLNGGTRLLLTPNQSMSWRGNVRVWLALCGVSLAIAGGMAWLGAWVVLPFAGLELAALATAIYLTSLACRRREILTITDEALHLEKGIFRKQAEWHLPRPYARLRINPPLNPVAPPRLFLVHREKEVALANFLNRDDIEALVSLLEHSGLAIDTRAPAPPSIWM
ncbi:DUF2244 domain-containing protein [Marinobacter mobilis]|uniref:DUF2244 domain-containing protein n=1 Tax=Marinobacter mobilis TaxID=488533 RepID=UPI0035C671B1